MKVPYLIIGAGPCGLGAGYRLKELGHEFLILEQNSWVGGLATSFVDPNGFTWDIGGHVQFSHYPYFDAVMELAITEWLFHQRESWVWIQDRFIPYPFQNNIRYLPPESCWECLHGIIDATLSPAATNPRNFHEWILAVFGQGIAKHFMLPYNYKVWAYPPEDMAYHWIGDRVSVVDLARVSENIVKARDDLSWGPNNTFRFPRQGGTGAIWNRVADLVGRNRIRCGATVTKIDPESKTATLSSGESIDYDHLMSTMPIDKLTQCTSGVTPLIIKSAKLLKHSSSHIVGIGLRGQPKPELSPKCWMYFPESSSPFYRVTLFSKYSPLNVPDSAQQYSLMTETSESPVKPVDRNKLVEEVIAGLRATKLIAANDEVVSTWYHTVDYGYPTPSTERDDILTEVIPALDQLEVYSRGRFGAWKYEVSNQDHSFMQGVEWANFKALGQPELTWRDPKKVNGR